jgi:archaemetzincin
MIKWLKGITNIIICICLLCSISQCTKHINNSTVIAIQPLGSVSTQYIEAVRKALTNAYGAKIIVYASLPMPQKAFVNIKTPRYRADILIDYLKSIKPDSADYILGLTEYDISITKTNGIGRVKQPESRYNDFGIFGLGNKPGVSCVVSTFRLGKPNSELAFNRLAKITVHEIGHNLGLNHCPDKKCVLTDAVEKISTIDNTTVSYAILVCTK